MKLVDTSPTQSEPKIHYQIMVQHSKFKYNDPYSMILNILKLMLDNNIYPQIESPLSTVNCLSSSKLITMLIMMTFVLDTYPYVLHAGLYRKVKADGCCQSRFTVAGGPDLCLQNKVQTVLVCCCSIQPIPRPGNFLILKTILEFF